MSDLLAAYGGNVLALPKRQQFGLWLHTERIRFQHATAVALGIYAAFSKGKLDRAWYDAIARDESEVDALEFTVNAERMHQATMAKFGITR